MNGNEDGRTEPRDEQEHSSARFEAAGLTFDARAEPDPLDVLPLSHSFVILQVEAPDDDDEADTTEVEENDEVAVARLLAEILEDHQTNCRNYVKNMEEAFAHMIRQGNRLIKIQRHLRHNNMENWVAENCPFSERTGQNYMKLAASGLKTAVAADLGLDAAILAVAEILGPKPWAQDKEAELPAKQAQIRQLAESGELVKIADAKKAEKKARRAAKAAEKAAEKANTEAAKAAGFEAPRQATTQVVPEEDETREVDVAEEDEAREEGYPDLNDPFQLLELMRACVHTYPYAFNDIDDIRLIFEGLADDFDVAITVSSYQVIS